MIILNAFIIGGLICAIAQFIMDKFKIMPIYVTCLFVVIGALLDFFDIYDKLIKFSGAGALLPITSFGHSLADGAYNKAIETDFLGIFTGMFTNVSAGIAFAIILSVLTAMFFKPKE